MSLLTAERLPHYHYAEYLQWEGRWELIEGVPYAMSPAPTRQHQLISQKIAGQLFGLLQTCDKCEALLPVDWRINDFTVVQPDNLVVCHPSDGAVLTQAPELIFEILSPSTAQKDLGIKFDLYQQEGVSYYVIVDPETQVAKVYALTNDGRLVKKLDAHKASFIFDLPECRFEFDFSKIW